MARYLILAGLLFFFFPFVTVSCLGKNVITLTGVQYVTGAKMPAELKEFAEGVHRMGGQQDATDMPAEIPPNPYAIAALIGLVVAALGAFGTKGHRPNVVAGGAGIAAAAALLALKLNADSRIDGQMMVVATWQLGFWGALLCAGLGGAMLIRGGGLEAAGKEPSHD